MLHGDGVEVGYVLDKSFAVVFVDSLRTETFYVHGFTRDKMFYATFYLRRTSRVIRAVPCRLTFVAH